MALLDPLFMDIDEVYSGDEFGLPYRDLVGEGVVDLAGGDFEVTAGSGNSVDVAAGAAWVEGDTNTARQPTYRCINDAIVNLGISPDPSNPRKVLIILQITDEAFDGTGREVTLEALHGTPAASPSDPTLPDSAYKLATLTVPTGAADSSAYTITDNRAAATIGAGNLGLNSAQTFTGVKAYDAGGQVITSGAAAAVVAMDSEEFDSDGFHDGAGANPSRLTVPAGKDGTYWVFAHLVGSGHSNASQLDASLLKNGSVLETSYLWDADAGNKTFRLGTMVELVEGDYIEVNAHKASGASAMTISGGVSNCQIGMYRVG